MILHNLFVIAIIELTFFLLFYYHFFIKIFVYEKIIS